MRIFAATVAVAAVTAQAALAAHTFHAWVHAVPKQTQSQVIAAGEWHQGCPVPFYGLRLLTMNYWGFDGNVHVGTLLVNKDATAKLTTVFGKLFAMRFPIHHMSFANEYGPRSAHPADGDVTASMECRQAVPSPCSGGTGTGHWSEHAYGEAVDLNPVENPYVGCGMTRDPHALSYLNRSNVRKGMTTPAVLHAFESVGWGWGGSWSGSTKDYMHYSATGH